MSLLVTGPKWLDNLQEDDTLEFKWETHTAAGASVDPTVAGTIRIYKNSSIVERTSASGITDTRTFDGLVGIQSLTIDTSDNADPGFYVAFENYMVVLVGATIDGVANVNAVLAHFSTENRFHNMGAVSQDKTAADNFETMLDGTGGEVLSLGQLNVVASGGNSAIRAIGNGAGNGIESTGGSTGHGIDATGGSTSGDGIFATGNGQGSGLCALGTAQREGILSVGNGPASGIKAQGGSSSGSGITALGQGIAGNGLEALGNQGGHGFLAESGSTGGDGIHAESQTDGDGVQGVGAGTGFDFNGDLNGSVNSVDSQVGSAGASINTTAINFTLTTGTVSSGSIADTVALDGVTMDISDTAGVIDCEYEFSIGGNGVPVQVGMTGRMNGGNDDINVFAFDYNSSTFVQIGSIDGKAGASNDPFNFTLFTSMVGSGINLGQVRIQFQGTGMTSGVLHIDQLFVSFAVVSLSVGYQNGAVWIDTVNGSAGTEPFLNGTADNPSLTLADATTIAASVGLQRFQVVNGSSITLAQTYDDFVFDGGRWTLDLGGQQATDTTFLGAGVTTGTLAVTSVGTRFIRCLFGNLTAPVVSFVECAFQGAVTFTNAGDAFMFDCFDGVAGQGQPSFNVGSAGNTNLQVRNWAGGVNFLNLGNTGTDTVDIQGDGDITLDATCVGGTVVITGNWGLTNNGSGITLIDGARFENDKNADHILRRNTASARASVNGDTVTVRSALGAVSKLTNKIDTTTNSGFLTVFEEDDSTEFYRQSLVTDANADPITEADTV